MGHPPAHQRGTLWCYHCMWSRPDTSILRKGYKWPRPPRICFTYVSALFQRRYRETGGKPLAPDHDAAHGGQVGAGGHLVDLVAPIRLQFTEVRETGAEC